MTPPFPFSSLMPEGWPGNRNQLIQNFQRIFRGKAHLMSFMHPLLGFDVVKFDDWLKPPDGTSTEDFIKQQYGPEAVALMHKLINSKSL